MKADGGVYRERRKTLPGFYECSQEGLDATGAGWETVNMGDREVTLCRPAKSRGKKRTMQIFCYYCLACVSGRKIGHKAQWTGRTPKWCPLGRGLETEEQT